MCDCLVLLHPEFRSEGGRSEQVGVCTDQHGSSDSDDDSTIEGADDNHRGEEEEECGNFEGLARISIRADVASGGFRDRSSATEIQEIYDAVLQVDRYRTDTGSDPDPGDDPRGTLERSVLVLSGPHRVTDGDVALDRERRDGQDGDVRCGLSGHGSNHAEGFSEDPRIGGPERECFQRKTEQEHEEVGSCQVGQVEVGDCPHVWMADDDQAGEDVADQSGEEDDAVCCGHRYGDAQRLALRSEVTRQEIPIIIITTIDRMWDVKRANIGRISWCHIVAGDLDIVGCGYCSGRVKHCDSSVVARSCDLDADMLISDRLQLGASKVWRCIRGARTRRHCSPERVGCLQWTISGAVLLAQSVIVPR